MLNEGQMVEIQLRRLLHASNRALSLLNLTSLEVLGLEADSPTKDSPPEGCKLIFNAELVSFDHSLLSEKLRAVGIL